LLQRVANPVSTSCGTGKLLAWLLEGGPETAIFSMRPLRLKSKCLPSGIQLGASKRSGAM
jgi:hypothetical protein